VRFDVYAGMTQDGRSAEGVTPLAASFSGHGSECQLAQEQQGQQHKTPLWVLKAAQLLGAAAWACFARYINIYFSEIGLTRTQIGILGFTFSINSCIGSFAWGALIDWLGEYKRTLVATQIVGTAAIFLYMVAEVKSSFALVFIVTLISTFMLSTGGPIIDAMCLHVLSEENVTDEAYGDQRLWCAVGWGGMALVAGQLIDTLGTDFMFIGFASIQAVNIGICVTFMPQPKPRSEAQESPSATTDGTTEGSAPKLLSFEVLWFFANLVQYGVSMSLIEGFLAVWLLQDFEGATKLLYGVATVVMCLFEVPVFKYIGRLWKGEGSMTYVLLGCQVMLIIRLYLYTLLPSDMPALVLLVEPLHGICFAAMWAATVEYAKTIAPPGGMARLQSLVNGLYYCMSMGVGSALWGYAVEPEHLGFNSSFYVNAVILAVWAVIWHSGIFLHRRHRRRGREARQAGALAASSAAASLVAPCAQEAVAPSAA